jgi:hypothetical protein
VLWPPNHKLVKVKAFIQVSDDCDPDPAITLVSITSDEPDWGHHSPDIVGASYGSDDRSFFLRAERRTGHGYDGRVYTITYRVTDASGNFTEVTDTVVVPKSHHHGGYH